MEGAQKRGNPLKLLKPCQLRPHFSASLPTLRCSKRAFSTDVALPAPASFEVDGLLQSPSREHLPARAPDQTPRKARALGSPNGVDWSQTALPGYFSGINWLLYDWHFPFPDPGRLDLDLAYPFLATRLSHSISVRYNHQR